MSSASQKDIATTISSSKGTGCLAQIQRCPCGNDQCLITLEDDEEDVLPEPVGPSGHNLVCAPTPNPSEANKVIPPPIVGQSFQSDDEALEYYTNFARNSGFSVRRERSKGNAEHPLGVHKRELVCHRAGQPLARKSEEVRRRRNKKSVRCKCEAQMVIKKNASSSGVTRWVVVNFSNEHNHELLDSNEAQCLPSYRYISTSDRDRILALAKGGCTMDLIMRALEMEKGLAPGQLTFTEKDLKNFLQSSKCVNRDNEGSELLKACKAMKERNPDFRYEFTLDENNKFEHVVWSYLSSIRAYNVFGDVVVFDTTQHLYAYDRPVGAWFGIDNHGHTIFFGCAILLDEKPESLRWALQSFIRLMDGKLPLTILTDLDIVLKDVISTELPTLKHAFFIWHVITKLSSWLSSSLGSQLEKFKSEFYKIYGSETTEEFEQQFNQLIAGHNLLFDKHVSLLYDYRSYWAQPYLQGWFFGGLLTAEKLISIKSFLKGFLSSQTRLKDFVEQVGVAVDFQNQAGEEAATQQNQQDAKIKTCMPIEEHASTVLTQYAFEMFQREIMSSAQFAVFDTPEGYLVRHHLKPEGGNLVNSVPVNEEVYCSCKGFESNGILCKHALRVLTLQNYFMLPDKYLLTRWRRESSLFPKSSGCKFRSQALRSLASIIIQESSVTKDRFDYVQWHLSRLLSQVREMGTIDEVAASSEPFDAIVDIFPTPSAPRGRPRKLKAPAKITLP